MIYQPRSIQPLQKSIDGTKSNEISMVMNTTSYVKAYRLTIYNMDNTIFYQNEKTNFSENLYNGMSGYINLDSSIGLENGKDYKWTARLYQEEPDMLIVYGNIVNPTTYTYMVGSGGLSANHYYFNINGDAYAFELMDSAVNSDVISFDTTSELVTLISESLQSSFYLSTTKILTNNFGSLATTHSGTKYTYNVGTSGLLAGNYYFNINGTSYWFTTLSDLVAGDKIELDTSTMEIKQTHVQSGNNIVLTLNYIYGTLLNATKSANTKSQVYLQKNINIKNGMFLKIGNETKSISSYNVSTGLAVLSSPFSNTPTNQLEYSVYSDFIEIIPENMLYIRKEPVVSILGDSSVITNKNSSFNGVYTQDDGVPLIYYLWNLYSVNKNGKTLVKSSKKTYSANIIFDYDGFKNGETYQLELVCENEYGVVAKAQKMFGVSYDEITYDEQPVAEQTREQGIRVSWLTTVLTEPYSISTDTLSGYIQSSNNTSSSMWIQSGQQIYPGMTIVVGAFEDEGKINDYNANTGYVTLSSPLSHAPDIGDYYYIYTEPNYNLEGIEIKQNEPYSGVNTAIIGNNHLVYYKNTGLSTYPDDFQLTLQLSLDDNFFYNENNTYKDIAMIARYEGTDTDGKEDLLVFAMDYNFYAITPSVENGDLVAGVITDMESDGSAIYISTPYDIYPNTQKFINFPQTGYISYIEGYDLPNNKIILSKNIPNEYLPSIGDVFFLYDTVSAAYYDAPNNVFCLQENNFISPYSDYIWTDSGIWNDSYFWVEGGTPIGRATNTWWKIQITNDSMVVERGGV